LFHAIDAAARIIYCANNDSCKYLNQKESAIMDEELMGSFYGFTTDQLMELAGLSCAAGILEAYPVEKFGSVLVVCGPGSCVASKSSLISCYLS
jgi:NAD(P)H-hydrate epimerase